MKTSLLLILTLTLFIWGCKKSDDGSQSSTQANTSEYFTWTVTGDSFSNEPYSIQKSPIYFPNSYPSTKGLLLLIENKSSGHTEATLQINASSAGTYPVNKTNVVILDLRGRYEFPSVFSSSGQITITHYAKSPSEYFTGTFSGVFSRVYNKPDSLVVTNGKFRIRRTF